MGWPNVHLHRAALGDNTTEGWRRGGWWEPTGTPFRKGSCDMLYKRTCPGDRTKQVSLITGSAVDPVSDIEAAYAPRVIYTNTYVFASGRWSEIGGECIDQVDNGCYNNGTCTAPDTV